MNILMLSWRDIEHPNSGGAEIATHEHAKAWVKSGHSVVHFASNFKGAERNEVVDGVEYNRFGYQYIGVHLGAFFWYFFGKHEKFDLVVDQFHGIPFFTPLYVRKKKLAYIHEVTKEIWKLNPWPKPFNHLIAAIMPFVEPFIFKIFYRNIPFMTVSESTETDLIKFGIPKKNIKVIHNGINIIIPGKYVKKEQNKTAMFLGAIAKDKGIKDAIKAFSEINQKEEGWQFWVVGKASPSMKRLILKQSKKYGLEDKLKYWGYVAEKMKFELLKRAHVLVNPSVREGWGLVNIEANAVGTPVVAYDVAGVRDSIKDGETGKLCIKRSPKCLALKSIQILNNRKKYKNLRKKAENWSRKFSWEKSTGESIELIMGLV